MLAIHPPSAVVEVGAWEARSATLLEVHRRVEVVASSNETTMAWEAWEARVVAVTGER